MKIRAPHWPHQVVCQKPHRIYQFHEIQGTIWAKSDGLHPSMVAYCFMWWPTAPYSGLLSPTVAYHYLQWPTASYIGLLSIWWYIATYNVLLPPKVAYCHLKWFNTYYSGLMPPTVANPHLWLLIPSYNGQPLFMLIYCHI